MKLIFQLVIAIFIFGGCETDDCEFYCDNEYESDEFVICIENISCSGYEGEYCLMGYKWGADNDFESVGPDAEGPKTSGGLVTYSFQENATKVNTHRQVDVPTHSFDILPSCAKMKIEMAFEEWSSVANIQFEKLSKDSDSDIKIFLADTFNAGLAFPNFNSSLCKQISGQIIFNPNDSSFPNECDQFYLLALHEIGHALGLGHSSANHIMSYLSGEFFGLQIGDIEGIQQIYGTN